MAAVVAHEVKNPIAGIRGALQVIASRMPADSRDKPVVGDIIARLDSLNGIVHDLLVFARPRKLRSEAVDLDRLIRRLQPDIVLNDRLPGTIRLVWFELLSRRGLDLILAPLLWIPFLSQWIRERLQTHIVCAFVHFEDSAHEHVGCRLHPTRWNGVDLRQTSAFRLLHGFSCGSANFLCSEAKRFALSATDTSDPADALLQQTSVSFVVPDWYDYSKAIRDRSG